MNGVLPLLGRWNALPRAIRLVASVALAAAFAVAIAAAVASHQTRIALFASPLFPEQRAEVEESLAAWGIPFAPTGDNVIVDARRRADLLLRLSLAGIPHPHLSSTGEALASIGALTPQAVIDAQTRAGLAGDIEAGLRGIEGVDDARVIVAPAKPAEFADESNHTASASVRLRLHNSARLSRQAVAGIRSFVAASVPELDPARVTILDDRGTALGDDVAMGDDAGDLQRSLQSALDAAFGEGAAIVRVRAEYETVRKSQKNVSRSSGGEPPLARTRRTESYDANGKRYRQVAEVDDRGEETREALALSPAGGLKRLTAAVFVNRARALDLTKVRELAGAALGFDARRGDRLAVESVEFRQASVARPRIRWLLFGAVVSLLPALFISVALLAAAKLALPPAAAVVTALVERSAVERASKTAVGFPPARVRSMLEQEPPHAAAAIISALPAATATAVLELYPPHEREAIVNRMQRRHSPLLSNPDEFLRRRV